MFNQNERFVTGLIGVLKEYCRFYKDNRSELYICCDANTRFTISAERSGIVLCCIESREDGGGSLAFGPTPPGIREWWDADGCATEKHPLNRSPSDWAERIRAAFPEATKAQASFTLIPIELPPIPPCWEYPWTMPFREGIRDWRTGELRRSL